MIGEISLQWSLRLTTGPYLSQMCPAHTLPPSFLKFNLILFSYLRLDLPNGFSLQALQPKFLRSLHAHYIPVHRFLLDLNTAISGEENKLCSSSLRYVLQLSFTLGPNIHLCIFFAIMKRPTFQSYLQKNILKFAEWQWAHGRKEDCGTNKCLNFQEWSNGISF